MSSYRPFRFGLEVRPAASKDDWATKAGERKMLATRYCYCPITWASTLPLALH